MGFLIKLFLFIGGFVAVVAIIVAIASYSTVVADKIFCFLSHKKTEKEDDYYTKQYEKEEKLMRQIEILDEYEHEGLSSFYRMKIRFLKNDHIENIRVDVYNYNVEMNLADMFTNEELYFIGLNAARIIEKARTEEEEKKQAEKEMRRINLRKQYLEE